VAAAKEPKIAQRIAMVRSCGVAFTGGKIPPSALKSESTERDSNSDDVRQLSGKRKAGRATKRTPAKAIKPAVASLTVNGS
jgi:hypothetical protein